MYAIIHPFEPFDAMNGTTISFTWNGNQIHKIRLIVKENETGEIVLNEISDSMKSYYTIKPNSGLINGTYYIMYLTVFDIDGNESELQNVGTPFYCFSTPTFSLSISNSQIIKSSSYETTLSYSQKENELLDSYEILLYSFQKIQLQNSGKIYNTTAASYLLSGMEDGMQYYVRAIGTTLHGIFLDTGFIPFSVAYEQKQIFSIIEANNMPAIGGIELRSNIVSTEGQAENDVIYIDEKYADLRNNSVTFDIGYEVSGDNTHVFSFYNPNINQPIITIKDQKSEMIINFYYREGIFEDSVGKQAVIELDATMNDIHYIVYSNYFNIPLENENIQCCVNRIGNFFDVIAMTEPRGSKIIKRI